MKFLGDLKIKGKLIISFVLVAILTGVVGTIGIIDMKNQNLAAKNIFESNFLPSQNISEIQKNLLLVRSTYLLMLYEKSESKLQQRIDDINNATTSTNSLLSQYEKTITTDEDKALFNTLKEDLQVYRSLRSQGVSQVQNNKIDEAIAGLPEATKAREKVDKDIQDMIELNKNLAKDINDTNTKSYKSQSMFMLGIIVVAIVLAIGLGLLIAKIIGKPIYKLVEAANKMAAGDMDVDINIDTKDEVGILGQAFKKMAFNMNDVLININASSDQVAGGAKQIADSSMELSEGATEQASSIEELTASIEEISSQTRNNADNAAKANELAEVAKNNALKGNSQMNEMLNSMNEINDASSNISKIIKVIEEIAFQTNILALNAAVEAARAGQHGKGFAVVAEEVRNLAARSANAAKETTMMIEGSIKKVEDGTKIANETAKALNEMVINIEEVAELVGDISVSSNEQALGIEQITEGITQVSQVVQSNSATSEESAAASEELSSQAEMLKEMVGRFNLKHNYGGYNNNETLSPEIIKMLENMKNNRDHNNSNTKISLSDDEYGRY
ncbi:methyl-accepting chemotaxis protein [Clostridium paridis]|uniref:MCP four helix bundle domain-containing protein n=1 Tax=Clostridium paridis TaxID=2803863 RepID=A0A937FJI4_9CLOT|nr:methyl-accepting chemotaxis protein [Clostridium paridis]MBL4933468.1 MCP four helix bundle domain-containing protein [Clostridium paridis]